MSTGDAARLLEMIGASWMSQAVCSAVELRLAELLANGAQDTADLARATDCDPARCAGCCARWPAWVCVTSSATTATRSPPWALC